jgi:hypothetical protein
VIQLNFGGHRSSDPNLLAVPLKHQKTLIWARSQVASIAKRRRSADAFFKSLALKRSLTELIADNSIWVSYVATTVYYGEIDRMGGREIGISELAFSEGRQMVLATLIHELAHAAGAAIAGTHDAERAVLECGLGNYSEARTGKDDLRTPYAPGLIGSVGRPRTSTLA